MKISKQKTDGNHQRRVWSRYGTQMPGMTPDGEIDREGRMAKRQLSDISEYAQ